MLCIFIFRVCVCFVGIGLLWFSSQNQKVIVFNMDDSINSINYYQKRMNGDKH